MGVSEAIDIALRAILNPGDKVLYHEPCYVSYAPSVTLAYGEDNTYNITIKNIVPETGDILVFPNWLRHYVYPFTTDVERISVAGNVYTDKTFMGASTHKDGGNVLEAENPHKEFSKKAYEHLQSHKHIKKH